MERRKEKFLEDLLSGRVAIDDERIAISSAREDLVAREPLFFIGVPIPPKHRIPFPGLKRVVVESNPISAGITSISEDTIIVLSTEKYYGTRLIDMAKSKGIEIVTTKVNKPPVKRS